jgi:hypothetical protein
VNPMVVMVVMVVTLENVLMVGKRLWNLGN